jgi:hypothetical protein
MVRLANHPVTKRGDGPRGVGRARCAANSRDCLARGEEAGNGCCQWIRLEEQGASTTGPDDSGAASSRKPTERSLIALRREFGSRSKAGILLMLPRWFQASSMLCANTSGKHKVSSRILVWPGQGSIRGAACQSEVVITIIMIMIITIMIIHLLGQTPEGWLATPKPTLTIGRMPTCPLRMLCNLLTRLFDK